MNVNTPDQRLWSMPDVAEYLGCTVRHVQNLMTAGLPHFKLGRLVRFSPEEVRAYLLKTRRVEAH